MSVRIVDRNVVRVTPKPGKPWSYRRVYTELEEGPVKEYAYGETSIFTRDEGFAAFGGRPYIVLSEGEHFLLITPRWTGLHAGWLDPRSTPEFNVYRVDRFALWAHLIPEELLDQFDFPEPPFRMLRVDGKHLTGSDAELSEAWRRYREHLLRREPLGIRIKENRILSLYERLLLDGVMPFTPRRVETLDKWKVSFKLRPYQEEAFRFWRENGATALVWPYGAGKSLFALRLIAAVSGPTLIVTPGKGVVKTMEKYLKNHLEGPRIGVWYGEEKRWGDVVVSTYQSVLGDKERFKGPWKLLIFDECHHWPAPTYTEIGFIEAEYRVGLSGSPWREDGKTHLIYLLSGPPYGWDWGRLIGEGWVRKPTIYLHITEYKLGLCKRLMDELSPRLLVYCDSIQLGREAEKMLGIPFVHGRHTTRARERMLREHERLICSRIWDEGIDLPDLQSMIELDFQGASRRQESQRAGRLMHCLCDGATYHILMTQEEHQRFGGRLQGLYAQGFEIKTVRE